MKTGTAVCAIAGLLFISVVLLGAFGGASAQSGKIIPKPTTAAPAESPKQPEARPKFVADPDTDKYKLVFPISASKKIYKDPPKNGKEQREREKELEQDSENISASYRNSFIEQLNKAGDQGYRLIALDYPFIGIVRQGNVQYEYAGFEMTSWIFVIKEGFKGNFERGYAQLARQGFSVVDHVLLRKTCENKITTYDNQGPISDPHPARCDYDDLFLLEREKGVEVPRQYRLAMHFPRWSITRSGSGAELTTQINDYRALGFNPILASSEYEVLLQPGTAKAEFWPVGTEVKVVTGMNLKKKVNELARQGYRLALTHYHIAVMYRNRDTTAPVSYIWLDCSKKKSFEQELARLQESGAVYRMTYGDLDILIFEQPAPDISKRREYKVLKIQFQETENFADQKVDIDLAPSSKETIKTLNSLVKEGFAVRDSFNSDAYAATHDAYIVNILLERTQ